MIVRMEVITTGRRPPLRGAIRVLCASLALASLLGALGCVYRMPIQQGNHLDETTIAQVKAGMTRAQVRYLLGTPMVPGDGDRIEIYRPLTADPRQRRRQNVRSARR